MQDRLRNNSQNKYNMLYAPDVDLGLSLFIDDDQQLFLCLTGINPLIESTSSSWPQSNCDLTGWAPLEQWPDDTSGNPILRAGQNKNANQKELTLESVRNVE